VYNDSLTLNQDRPNDQSPRNKYSDIWQHCSEINLSQGPSIQFINLYCQYRQVKYLLTNVILIIIKLRNQNDKRPQNEYSCLTALFSVQWNHLEPGPSMIKTKFPNTNKNSVSLIVYYLSNSWTILQSIRCKCSSRFICLLRNRYHYTAPHKYRVV
jgi:hypothetical protein